MGEYAGHQDFMALSIENESDDVSPLKTAGNNNNTNSSFKNMQYYNSNSSAERHNSIKKPNYDTPLFSKEKQELTPLTQECNSCAKSVSQKI